VVLLLLLVNVAGHKGLALLLLLLELLLPYCSSWLQCKRLQLLDSGCRSGAASTCMCMLSLLLLLLRLLRLVRAGVVVCR
jgi:hypothetical protein